jgi:hypothetical protein
MSEKSIGMSKRLSSRLLHGSSGAKGNESGFIFDFLDHDSSRPGLMGERFEAFERTRFSSH